MTISSWLEDKIDQLDHPDFDQLMNRKRLPRRRNTLLRVGGQAAFFAFMMGCAYVAGQYNQARAGTTIAHQGARSLAVSSSNLPDVECPEDNSTAFPPPAVDLSETGEEWLLVFIVIGLMYMFWALAIVVDEFFVPALDVIADKLEISHDVAGATLMAAGGSAPEFFTSLFSAVQEPSSATGFGTIVGSAVFNVLFVIAACAMFAKETLHLTWWPLFRDVTYYSISLVVLALFFLFGGSDWYYTEEEKQNLCLRGNEAVCCYQDKVSDEFVPTTSGVIPWTEALFLFLMYIGYVLLMKYQRDLYWQVMKRFGGAKYGKRKYREEIEDMNRLFTRASSFRAGVLQILSSDNNITDQAGIGAVCRIKGNVHDTFLEIDKDRNGFIDSKEIGLLLQHLGVSDSEENIAQAMHAVDENNDNRISEDEFTKWYLISEARLENEMDRAFDSFDADKSGTIDRNELAQLLRSLGNVPTDAALDDAFDAVDDNNDNAISREEFRRWYRDSLFWKDARERQAAEVEEAETPLDIWQVPKKPRALLFYLLSLPIVVPLYFTVFNTRVPKYATMRHASFSFFMSILWIALYSWVMVFCAETFGKTLDIPDVVMGVTILAAGTSIPDLLSSVIVARQGHGDMAVSSSIGSNIFDILVGLPIPWMLSCAVKGRPVLVGASNIGISIGVLLGMLVSVIVIIKISNWQLNKKLAFCMMTLYVVFVVQDLARADWEGKGSSVTTICQSCREEMVCLPNTLG